VRGFFVSGADMAIAAAPGREAEEAAGYGEGSKLTAAARPTAPTVIA
jgi:hypothetical protein